MKCPQCQAEITTGHKFCMSCGTPVPANATVPLEPKVAPQPAQPKTRKKSPKKWILIAIVCVILAVFAIAFGDLDTYFEDPTTIGTNPSDAGTASDTMTESTPVSDDTATEQTELTESVEEVDPYYAKAYEVAVSEYSKYIDLLACSTFMQKAYENEITSDMLNRQPEYYEEMEVYFGGTVLQTIYDADNPSYVELRISDFSSENEENVIYVTYTLKSGETRILEGDYVDMYGISKGLITYESVRGDRITIPLVDAKYVYAYAEVEGSLDTPTMKTFKDRVYGDFVSEDGTEFSFGVLEEITDNVTSVWANATKYEDCIVAYYEPEMGWDPDNPPPFYRVVSFSDGTMVIFEPNEDADEGTYALDDGTYTKYTPVPKNSANRPSGEIADSEMYIGDWGDEISQRAGMYVTCDYGQFTFVITWGNSASSTSEWILCGEYDNDTGYIIYEDGKYSIWETDSEGSEPVEYVQYTNGTGQFRIEDGYLYWDDFRNHAGDECRFVKFD